MSPFPTLLGTAAIAKMAAVIPLAVGCFCLQALRLYVVQSGMRLRVSHMGNTITTMPKNHTMIRMT